MKKKILHVITNYTALGGAEMMLQKLILSQPEYDHYIISLLGISEVYIESLSKVIYARDLGWKISNTAKTILLLKNEIKNINPDIIQCWMYHANFMTVLACKLGNINVPIFWGIHHSLNSLKEESLSTKTAIYLNRLLASNVQGIIYCANSSLEQHKKFGFKNSNQVFIPNGVDIGKFRFIERSFDLPLTIGFVGRYHKAKGIPCLFKVMAAFKDDTRIKFRVAGSGLDFTNKEIKELFEYYKLGKNVELLGSVREMEKFYHGIDLLLMTSITEGFPNVLIEAMATGVVCFSTDVGDASNIIDDKKKIAKINYSIQLINAIKEYITLPSKFKLNNSNLANELTSKRFSMNTVQMSYTATWFLID